MANPIPGGWQDYREITVPADGDSVYRIVVNGQVWELNAGETVEVPYPVYERFQVIMDWKNTPPAEVPQGAGGGSSMEPILINAGVDPMTASIPFEEAWALSVPELAARLCVFTIADAPELCSNAVAVSKQSTTTWGHHIVAEFHGMETLSGGVLCMPIYIVWAEGDSLAILQGGAP